MLNLAKKHLAAEDIFASQRQALLELEGDLGLLVTGDRDTFEKVLNKIKEYKAYEILKDENSREKYDRIKDKATPDEMDSMEYEFSRSQNRLRKKAKQKDHCINYAARAGRAQSQWRRRRAGDSRH